ncbi:MAG TPA: type II secretion system F family protein [Candidatus Paceibacterota bacterium]|nr:type II secretion system F family protein [Candidatus Paceibacterota bacterium]HPT18233.1 type II secretion system F family protein [Candidatus Paceibacterota bacterium]
MLFKYKAVDENGINKEGEIDAANRDMAISGLQRRGLIIISIVDEDKSSSPFQASFFGKVKMKEVVVLSRQISTLFGAQVPALKVFTMLASSTGNKLLARKLNQVSDDLQAGLSISGALSKHPDVFSNFYVNMVKSGEETGKLAQSFEYLANYLDRQYALTSKTKNALIYPIFVIVTFFVVMGLMFTIIIPKISSIISSSGQNIPVYTKIIMVISDFFVHYGFIIIIILVLIGIWLWKLSSTEKGKIYLDKKRLATPAVGDLFKKLYLSRISDNLDTMLTSGIPIIRSLEITADVVGSRVYKDIMKSAVEDVKSGSSLSSAFEKHPQEMPTIMVQMVKVGEETGSLGQILKTLADFYKREVDNSVETLVGLIEPVMIVFLGIGVGILLISVLVPIYNMVGGIS